MNQLEIESLVLELQSLLDSKVQKVFLSTSGFGFELFKGFKISYLWMELHPVSPEIKTFDHLPKEIKLKKSAPMLLFLKAHLIGKRISEINHIKDLGRVLEFKFGYDDPLTLEVSLYPHGVKAIAKFDNKNVVFRASKEAAKKEPTAIKEKGIEKKEKALVKVQAHLAELQNDMWAKVGEWLKENQSLNVPHKFKDYIDSKKTFSQNIQHCFEKAKKNHEKIKGTLVRIKALEEEIAKLKENSMAMPIDKEAARVKRPDKWKGYRLNLNPKVEVFVGKNAQENLNILRFAQSWDYWMHIKDYPGAHGIIRRPRNYQVTDEEFKEVARFIGSKSKKSAHFLSPNESFDVLIVECRYVRPIKGDKLGRVNYSNERVLRCKM